MDRTRGRNRRSARVTGLVALVVALLALPVALPPAEAADAPSSRDGLIAFSIGVQFPPGDADIAIPSDIWTIRPDGSGLRQLTHVPEGRTAALPAWSPQGGSIVFQTNVNGDNELWTMGAQGRGKRVLTSEPGYDHLTPSWAPDGRSVVFSRCHKPAGFVTACSLATVRADGTGMRVLLDGKRIHARPVFSPDGRTIAFQSDRAGLVAAIWLIDADGSNLRRLTAPSTLAYWPDFTPDGTWVTYSNNCCLPHSNVFSVPVGGGAARQLTDVPGLQNNAFASVSPSGRFLSLSSDEQHTGPCCTNDLVVQRPDGSQRVIVDSAFDIVVSDWGSAPLGPSQGDGSTLPVGQARADAAKLGHRAPVVQAALARRAAPSATGADDAAATAAAPPGAGRIVFFDFHVRQLFAVAPSGGRPVQLTHTDPNHDAGQPDVSPDGRRIVFTMFTNDFSAPARTWVMDADGSNMRQVSTDVSRYEHFYPQFTPDGRHIVFARCADVCSIWIMDADGSNKRAITPERSSPTEEAVDFFPEVSPDGSQVAFTRFFWRGISAQIFVVGIDGGRERAITPAWLEATRPTWSPGGGKLAVKDLAAHWGSTIWSLRPDGSSLRKLTATPYPRNDISPTWSPDGTRIAFQSDRRHPDLCCFELFTMRTDGLQEQRVPTGALNGVIDIDWGRSPPPG